MPHKRLIAEQKARSEASRESQKNRLEEMRENDKRFINHLRRSPNMSRVSGAGMFRPGCPDGTVQVGNGCHTISITFGFGK